MYHVSGAELENIASLSNSVHLAFFTLTAGAAIGILVAILGGSLSEGVRTMFVLLLAVTVVATVYFGVRATIDYRHAKREIDHIKSGWRD